MSNLSEVISIQQKLESNISKRFDELQGQITNATSSKDTVAKIGEELRGFREIVYGILGPLRQQIKECAKQVDSLEMWNRRKAIVISGLPESEGEDCFQLILKVLNTNLGLNSITKPSIKVCHRLGTSNKQRHRSILVRFVSIDTKIIVWKSKTKLKGSSVTIKEFLTHARQDVFIKARLHFGMRSVWTQNGLIIVRTSDSTLHRITTDEELSSLIFKFPETLKKANDDSKKKKKNK